MRATSFPIRLAGVGNWIGFGSGLSVGTGVVGRSWGLSGLRARATHVARCGSKRSASCRHARFRASSSLPARHCSSQ